MRARNLWKRYRTRKAQDLKRLLLWGGGGSSGEPSPWALRGVSFDLVPGDALGVIGHNGSGKSTLLALLLGALQTDVGTLETHGRIGALLELGNGFQPEFTGRENVYLYASILGLEQEEIDARFEEIVDFAELWDAIDAPLRTYSAGMNARLGFATIIHTPAEILLVDEVLGVGDARFQVKCFEWLQDFRLRGGSMVVVSHDLPALDLICTQGIYLHRGTVRAHSTMNDAIGTYFADLAEGVDRQNDLAEERQEPGEA